MPEVPSVNDTGNIPTPKSAQDIVDMFGEDDAKEVLKDPVKAKSEKSEKSEKKASSEDDDEDEKPSKKRYDKEDDDDDNEIEYKDPDKEEDEKLDLKKKDTEDEDDEDKEEKLEIDAPPRKKEINEAFPDFFKKFPFMEKMLYRDREYTQLFGSLDDAKEIAESHKELSEKAEVFTSFENDLLEGKTEDILKNVKDTDPKAFDKIVDNYLESIYKVDREAYFDVVNNMARRIIGDMYTEGKKSEDEEMQQAAVILNKFLFNTPTYTAPKKRIDDAKEDKASEESKKLETERMALIQEKFESSRDDLQVKVDNILRATIGEYIDPNSKMTGFVKKHAITETLRHLGEMLGSDANVKKTLDKLWRASFDAKFSKDSLSAIQKFYLGKAKPALTVAMKKARAEALKDSDSSSKKKEPSNKEEDDDDDIETTPRQRNLKPGKSPSQRRPNERQKGESVADFFARD